MIGVDDLLELILAEVQPPPARPVDLLSALGETLAEDVVAIDAAPPFANSAMDGFAIRRADLPDDPARGVRLHLVDDLPAGRTSQIHLHPKQAVQVATGAMLPPGADAVVPVEQAHRDGDHVVLHGPVPAHGHIRPAGEDVTHGETVARAGQRLTAHRVALCLQAGVQRAAAIPIPRVGILTTGDELVPPDAPLVPGAIRDVNHLILSSAIGRHGLTPVDLGRCRDDPDAIADRLTSIAQVDAIVVSGGLGRGARDVVVDAVSRIGTVRAFEVAMRPGKPFAVGRVADRPLFAVPGNPVAAVATLYTLVLPALARLAGRLPVEPGPSARLTQSADNRGGRRHLIRVALTWSGAELAATPVGGSGSGLVSALAAADGLLVIHESVSLAESGQLFPVYPFNPLEVW